MTHPHYFIGVPVAFKINTKSNIMLTEVEYNYKEGDDWLITQFLQSLEKLTAEELVDRYQIICSVGLSHDHQYQLFVLSLRIAILRLFESSPITIEDNCILKIKTPPFSLKKLSAGLAEPASYEKDSEYLSMMMRELRQYGEIRSEDVWKWWMNRY